MKFKIIDHIDHNDCSIMAILKLLIISKTFLLHLNDGNMQIIKTVCEFIQKTSSSKKLIVIRDQFSKIWRCIVPLKKVRTILNYYLTRRLKLERYSKMSFCMSIFMYCKCKRSYCYYVSFFSITIEIVSSDTEMCRFCF